MLWQVEWPAQTAPQASLYCPTSTNKELGDPQRGTWFCLEEAQTLKGEWKLQGFIRQRHGGHEKCSLVLPCRADSFSSPVTHHALHTLPSAHSQPRAMARGAGCSLCLECYSPRYLQVPLAPVLQAYAQSSPSLWSHLWTCSTRGKRTHMCPLPLFFSIVIMHVCLSAVGLLH